jgi:hypothetical protein
LPNETQNYFSKIKNLDIQAHLNQIKLESIVKKNHELLKQDHLTAIMNLKSSSETLLNLFRSLKLNEVSVDPQELFANTKNNLLIKNYEYFKMKYQCIFEKIKLNSNSQLASSYSKDLFVSIFRKHSCYVTPYLALNKLFELYNRLKKDIKSLNKLNGNVHKRSNINQLISDLRAVLNDVYQVDQEELFEYVILLKEALNKCDEMSSRLLKVFLNEFLMKWKNC